MVYIIAATTIIINHFDKDLLAINRWDEIASTPITPVFTIKGAFNRRNPLGLVIDEKR